MKANLSIKQIIAKSNKLMLILAIIPLLSSIILYSRQIYVYQRTFTNIEEANMIVGKVDQEVLEEMWDVVFGIRSVKSYQIGNVLSDVQFDINQIKSNTSSPTEIGALNVAISIIDTIKDYEKKILDNIEAGDSVTANEEIMNDVDSLTRLLIDRLKDFVSVEINVASIRHRDMIRSLILLTALEFLIILLIIYSVKKNKQTIHEKIEQPIYQLITMAEELAHGNLSFRADIPDTVELDMLTKSLNQMAEDLHHLLEENALKQYYLAQSEVRVLQAQITPHFIYNSLDTIISLIDQKQYPLASDMTYALSDFFRISLSKGKDWIFVERELKHISDYLTILKIRYGGMLTFSIDINQEILNEPILKMILQPLIENAVYHGTKLVRRIGHIQVTSQNNPTNMTFMIEDNGIGMTPERLSEVQQELNKGIDSDFSTGYGLYNVNKRLLLYYGKEASIKIKSTHNQGTITILTVPKKNEGIPYYV